MPEEISSHASATEQERAEWTETGEVGPSEQILPGDRSGRRRGRQTVTFLVIVAVVLSVGLVGLTYYYGLWGGTDDDSAGGCTTAATKLTPADVSMNVYNGSDRSGLAGSAAKQLKKRKFTVGEVANDPQQQRVRGVALIRHGAEGLAAARTVAANLKGKTTLKNDADRTGVIVDLVLGQKYAGMRTAKDAAKQLARTEPAPASTTCT